MAAGSGYRAGSNACEPHVSIFQYCQSWMMPSIGGGTESCTTADTSRAQTAVTNLASLSEFVRLHRRSRTLVFGVVSLHSTHTWLLRTWLASAGLKAEEDVRLVVVPPPQMPANLGAGNLDGFCVGEPWNSVAIARGDGWCAGTSCQLASGHPEKVLVLRGDFARDAAGRQLALTAALLEACYFCADPANRESILRLLARREYLGLPVEQLAPAWTGRFPIGDGTVIDRPDFLIFSREDSNDPSTDKAGWVTQHILDPAARSLLPPLELGRIFRSDLFVRARDQVQNHPLHETASETCHLAA